jgi:DtxR family Mn-dependent transcriptional regulator
VDDAHAPLRVRKEHYLEAIYSLGDGVTLSRLARALSVKPSSALKVVRERHRRPEVERDLQVAL